jgi:hypothetical protein
MHQVLEEFAPRVDDGSFMSQQHKSWTENGRGKAWYHGLLGHLVSKAAENGHGEITVADVMTAASK